MAELPPVEPVSETPENEPVSEAKINNPELAEEIAKAEAPFLTAAASLEALGIDSEQVRAAIALQKEKGVQAAEKILDKYREIKSRVEQVIIQLIIDPEADQVDLVKVNEIVDANYANDRDPNQVAVNLDRLYAIARNQLLMTTDKQWREMTDIGGRRFRIKTRIDEDRDLVVLIKEYASDLNPEPATSA